MRMFDYSEEWPNWKALSAMYDALHIAWYGQSLIISYS